MAFATIDPTKTGLLFFDMLNVYYREKDSNQVKNKALEAVMANAILLRDAARTASIPILYAIADHRADGTDTDPLLTDTNYSLQSWKDPERIGRQVPAARHGSWEAKVIDEIAPGPDDYLIYKHRWSSFYQTHLELSLRARGIDTLLVSGGSTEVGVASTAYSARDMGIHLIIVRDACSSSDPEVIAMFMDKVLPKMGRVRTTKQAIEMIQK